VGISEVKGYGQDLQIKLTDGKTHKFKLPGGGTAFGGGGGGGGGGASSLEDLSDVNVSSAQDGDKLVYHSPTQRWRNEPGATVTVSATPPSDPRTGDIWFDISS